MDRRDLQRWETELDGRLTPPVVSEGSVYVGVTDRRAQGLMERAMAESGKLPEVEGPTGVVAVDEGTGRRRWFQAGVEPSTDEAEGGVPAATPVAGDGLVYVAESEDSAGSVAALDVGDGAWVWRAGDGAEPLRPVLDRDRGELLAAWGRTDLIDPGVVGADARTGEHLWEYDDEGAESLAVVGDTCVLGGGGTYGLVESRGVLGSGFEVAWSFHTDRLFGGMAADHAFVYVLDTAVGETTDLYAVDPARAEDYVEPDDEGIAWRWRDDEYPAGVDAGGDRAFVLGTAASETLAVAVDAGTGETLWRVEEPPGAVPPVALDGPARRGEGGTAYVGTESGVVVAVDADDGSVRWRLQVGSDDPVYPAVAGDALVVANEGGTLAAVDRAAVPTTDRQVVVTDGEAGPTAAVAALYERTRDVDGLVEATREGGPAGRKVALKALSNVLAFGELSDPDDRLVDVALDRLDDGPDVQAEAALLLGRLADAGVASEAAVEPLSDVVAAGGHPRGAAIDALGAMAAAGVVGESTADLLEELADDDETHPIGDSVVGSTPAHPAMPTDLSKPDVAVLDCGLTVGGDGAASDGSGNPEVGIDDLAEMGEAGLRTAEWVERLVIAGADVAFVRGPVDDAVAGVLADEGVLAVDDAGVLGVEAASRATGADVAFDPDDVDESALGTPASVSTRRFDHLDREGVEIGGNPEAEIVVGEQVRHVLGRID